MTLLPAWSAGYSVYLPRITGCDRWVIRKDVGIACRGWAKDQTGLDIYLAETVCHFNRRFRLPEMLS